MPRLPVTLLLALTLPASLTAQKRQLGHEAYEIWKSITQDTLSRDGRWLAYVLDLQRGDDTLELRAVAGSPGYAIPRGRDARFSADGRFAVFTTKPEFAAVEAARRAKKKPEDMPKDSLGIMELASGSVTKAERVRSFQLPPKGGAWVAYLLERPRQKPDSVKAPPADSAAPKAKTDTTAPKPKKESETGTPLVLRNLVTGAERRFDAVMEYRFDRAGARLALATSSRMGDSDGVSVVDLGPGTVTRVAEGRGTYKSLAFDESGTQLAFLTSRDDAHAEHPRFALYRWQAGEPAAAQVAAQGTAGLRDGWTVSEYRVPVFSQRGDRLVFGVAPWVEPAPEDSTPDDERVKVDIWHWQDGVLQSAQLKQVERERRRSYLAVAHLPNGSVVQLADSALADVTLPRDGDGPYAVGEDDRAYRILTSWEVPRYADVYLVDLETGARTLVLERSPARARLSPTGAYLAWYDPIARTWMARDTKSGKTVDVTAAVPHPLFDEENDSPEPAAPYGSAGWTAGERMLLVYDRYDVWAVDPRGAAPPRCITEEAGRRAGLTLRVVDLLPDSAAIAEDAPLLLSAFDEHTKQAGFYRGRVRGARAPERLVLMERRFSAPRRAEQADVLLFTRESVAEFPDLWISGPGIRDMRKLSDANPQQAEYRWATVELIEWRGADGTPLQGLLYKPDDFDPGKRYPLLVNFYERSSDRLYAYHAPLPHRSTIQPSFYASRGYLVFLPDVRYRIGVPGQSAVHAVVPGVLALIHRGFVDSTHMGVQGHSWGGYQITYLVTRTNLFHAAAAGAPVVNMTSAYGGIRWETGISRMFQYEHTQSRIGASLWEAPDLYLENSPLFRLDKVETPLLILHNDQDGAVPWQQGIELFTAMRRLGKPAWLVSYNGEPHWPTTYANRRDWNIRLQQFFDYYLKGAPEPRWLREGISATEKGKTLGLDP
jgi:dipeptidyl aminopeptidase/acylaminoacyl peptidase